MDDIRDIKPPVALPSDWTWPELVGAGLVVAVAGLAVWRWRRMAASPARTLARAVLADIKALAATEQALDDRAFYYRLAELLRRALEARLEFAATAMTTEEILPRLAGSALPGSLQTAVAEALGRADPARYAGAAPDPSLRRTDLQTARNVAKG